VEPLARADPKVMAALRADEQVALELGPVELSRAARALDPQAFRHRAPPLLGVDAGRHQLVGPAHLRSSSRIGAFAGRAIIAQLDSARRGAERKIVSDTFFARKRCLTQFSGHNFPGVTRAAIRLSRPPTVSHSARGTR